MITTKSNVLAQWLLTSELVTEKANKLASFEQFTHDFSKTITMMHVGIILNKISEKSIA